MSARGERKTELVGAAAVAALALCALVASREPPADPILAALRRASRGGLDSDLFGGVVLAVAALGIVLAVVYIVVGRRRNKGDEGDIQARRPRSIAADILAIAILVGLAYFISTRPSAGAATPSLAPPPEIPASAEASPSGSAALESEAKRESGAGPGPWIAAVAFFACLACGAAAWSLAKRRGPSGEAPREPEAALLAEGIEAARRRLEEGSEARAAIIACYEEMSRLFREGSAIPGGPELGRGYERSTAREFLGLIRARDVKDGEVETLTSVFEKARYSNEACGEEDREAAMAAVAALKARYLDAAPRKTEAAPRDREAAR